MLAKQMSKAVELIVDCYVRLHNREALEKMEAERLQSSNGPSQAGGSQSGCSATIRQIENELEVIRSGLAQFKSASR